MDARGTEFVTLIQAVLANGISIVVIFAVLGGVMKVFQIGTTLTEIKDVLQEIKRNTSDYQPPAAGAAQQPQSGEEMLRALDSRLGEAGSGGSDWDREMPGNQAELDRLLGRTGSQPARRADDALDPDVVEPGDRHV